MKLVVLGSGTSVPHAARSSSAHWLETEAGTIMLDIGASSIHRMAQEKLDWVNLDAVWVSHFHLDHLGGLFPFLFGTKHAPDTQARPSSLELRPARVRKTLEHSTRRATTTCSSAFPCTRSRSRGDQGFEILPAFAPSFLHAAHLRKLAINNRRDTATIALHPKQVPDALAALRRRSIFLMECSFFRESRSNPLESKRPCARRNSGAPCVQLSNLITKGQLTLVAEGEENLGRETIERASLRVEI